MKYLHRFIENKIYSLTEKFSAVLLTGPRQAGKTTLLEHVSQTLFGSEVEKICFDTPSEIDSFRRDPDLFFLNHRGILLLDEVQHVPDIFPYIKREIDKKPGKFRFFLTGSNHFGLMKGVSESLSGRAYIQDLWPMARQEMNIQSLYLTAELFVDPSKADNLMGMSSELNDTHCVVPWMLEGGYPPVVIDKKGEDWLESYRRTYIQRDIRELSQVADLGKFDRFLTLCAGRSGTIINKAEMSNTLSLDNKTIDHWLSLLETSYQIISLPAYHSHTTKRVAKRPKWIFADSGLCLLLQGIRDKGALLKAPHFGNLFESFVIMELRKIFGHALVPWNTYHFRTEKGMEIDLIFESAGKLIPVEIKHTAKISSADLKPLKEFMGIYNKQTTYGFIISMHPALELVESNIYNIPLGLLLKGIR